MPDAHAIMTDTRARLRDLLVEVGALLQRSSEADVPHIVPEMDLKLRDCYLTVNACKRLLTVLRRAEPADYDPIKTLRENAFQNVIAKVDTPQTYRLIQGDPQQVVECVRLVMENVHIEAGSRLNVQVTPEIGKARVVLRIHGTGTLPETISVEGLHVFTLEEFAECWIDATSGGYIGVNEEGIILYLEGDRPRPLLRDDHTAQIKLLDSMARRLRAWRGTVGNYEPGLVSHAEVMLLYRDTIDRCLKDLETATT